MKSYKEFTPKHFIPFHTYKKEVYYSLPATFDIETSSYYNTDGEKRATMYIWQMCVFGDCYYGRTYKELLQFFFMLEKAYTKGKIIVYVHNLAYDSHFILKWLDVSKMFATDRHQPLYFEVDNYFVFKCSYRLSGKSLAKLSENFVDTTLQKQKGYDYSILRTWCTPLTDLELKYCEYDVKVLYQYILDTIEKDGDITKIPLTKTSYARRYTRTECYSDPNYRKWFEMCTPTDPKIYYGLRSAFMGGLTHCNRLYTGLTLDNITNYDLQSDYPSQILKNKFPCTPFIEAKLTEFPKNPDTAVLAIVQFKGLRPKTHHSLLSISKCMVYCETKHKKIFGCMHPAKNGIEYCPLYDTCKDKLVLDNGRIVQCGNVTTTITEIDFENICTMYNFDEYKILCSWTASKNYLPKCFSRAVLKLYRDKTVFKGDNTKKLEYALSKELLNSTYGMCVTNILFSAYHYTPDNEDMWEEVPPEDVEQQLYKYQKSRGSFLLYQTGVYITAYARRDLVKCIKAICDEATDTMNDLPFDDVAYYDTDSLKIRNGERYAHIFDKFNEQVKKDMQAAAKYHNLKFELFEPIDKKGRKQLLGKFDKEHGYIHFKTLGAKRYCYTFVEHFKIKNVKSVVTLPHFEKLKLPRDVGTFHITMAGVSKTQGAKWIKKVSFDTGESVFDVFDNDLNFPASRSGKITSYYSDTGFCEPVTDYLGNICICEEKSFIHMENTPYNMGIAEDYRQLLIHDFGRIL